MAKEHLYIVAYDISEPKRWKSVFKLMKGHGQWLQMSVFQCRLTVQRCIEMNIRLKDVIKLEEDHILIIDLGPADGVRTRVESLGKKYEVPTKKAIIV